VKEEVIKTVDMRLVKAKNQIHQFESKLKDVTDQCIKKRKISHN